MNKSWLDSKINENMYYAKIYPSGWLGVEIELEGEGITKPAIPVQWRVEKDGSLRGESMELVLKKPSPLVAASEAVVQAYQTLAPYKIHDSMRAGVHVHINCQELTVRQLFTFLASYYCLEGLITALAGEDREGNLFCLRATDAEETSFGIARALFNGYFKESQIFTSEKLRYAALNLVSLSTFGTVEFRALRTPTKAEPILTWLKLITTLFENSAKFKNPKEVLTSMSANGEKEVVKQLLGELAPLLTSQPDFETKLYRSLRLVQTWVYKTDWK